MMLTRVLRAALPAMLAGAFGLPLAHADIYTWIDASGTINVSNVPPPDGIQAAKIVSARPPDAAAREDAARDAARQADTQALAERVRELEDEVAARTAPPRIVYSPVPPPPVIQYIVEAPQPQVTEAPAPPYAGCDPTWWSCASWWAPGFYPASVIVVSVPGSRLDHPVRGRNGLGMRPPGRPIAPPPKPGLAAQPLALPIVHPLAPDFAAQLTLPVVSPLTPNFSAQQPLRPLAASLGLKRG